MDAFIGTISAFGFNFQMRDWSYCDGRTLSIQSNTALFALIGTFYGGNGTSTFALPNLQGRVAIDQGNNGQATHVIGEFGGADTVTLNAGNLPPHSHSLTVNLKGNLNARGGGNATTPGANYPSSTAALNVLPFNTAPSNGTFMKPPTITLGVTGGTVPLSVQDPGLVMNYCICQFGIFPTRN